MKQAEDFKTMELLPVVRRRGRPATGEAKSGAVRAAERRERLRLAGIVPVTVNLPIEVLEALQAFVKFKDLKIDDVIEKAVRQAVMRKR